MAVDTHNNSGHALSYKKLLLVLATLLCLTIITITVSRFNLGAFNIWIALSIAAAKTSLVLLYFMDLKDAGRPIVVTFLITVTLLAIAIGFIFWDVAFR